MKRLLSLLLALSMVISMFPVHVAAETTEEATETVILETVPEAAETTEPAAEPEPEPAAESEQEPVIESEPEAETESVPVETEAQLEETQPAVEDSGHETMTLGTIEVELPENKGQVTYSFTPEESAQYIVYAVDAPAYSTFIEVYGGLPELERAESANERLSFYGYEGITYEVTFNAVNEEAFTTEFCLDKCVAPEKIILHVNGQTDSYTVPRTDWQIRVDVEYEPANSKATELYWDYGSLRYYADTYRDADILEIPDEAVSSTVTVTDENGVSGSIHIRIPEYNEIIAGEDGGNWMDAAPFETVVMYFTPEVSGHYAIWDANDYYPYMEIETDNGMKNGHSAQGYMTAGQTYEVRMTNDYHYEVQFDVRADLTVEAEGFMLTPAEQTGYVGQVLHGNIISIPYNGRLEDFEWNITGGSVAILADTWGNGAAGKLVGAGTTTLTAATLSGKTASCTFHALPVITLVQGEKNAVIYDDGEHNRYVFTAGQTATYAFWEENGKEPWIRLYDTDENLIAEGSAFSIDLEEGQTVYADIQVWYGDDCELILCVDSAAKAAGISIPWTFFSFPGTVETGAKLYWEPENAARETVTWTTSDENVAVPENCTNDVFNIRIVGPGSATITATTESGLTASCPVTVSENIIMTADGSSNKVIIYGTGSNDEGFAGYAGFMFTAEEEGDYGLWDENYNALNFWAYGDDGYQTDSYWGWYAAQHMEAGETRVFVVCNDREEDVTVDYRILPQNYAESFYIEGPDMGNVGDQLRLDLRYNPGSSYRESITWSSSNEDVAVIGENWPTAADIHLVGEGMVTITAEGINGLSTSWNIQVGSGEMEELTLGQELDLHLEKDTYTEYTFTPEADGDYVIYENNDNWIHLAVYDLEGNELANRYYAASFEGKAGVTYKIIVSSWNDMVSDFNLHLEEAVQPESITLHRYGETGSCGMFQGEEQNLSVRFEPKNSIRSELAWVVGNEDILKIKEVWAQDDECVIIGEGAGETLVSVMDTFGNTSTLRINVGATIRLYEDEIVTATVDPFNDVTFVFTPEETATYAIWETEGLRPWMHIWGWNVDYETFRIEAYMEGGSTYLINIHNDSDQERTFSMSAAKTTDATGISFVEPEVSLMVGDERWTDLIYAPANAASVGLYWESSDSGVVEIAESGNDTARIIARSAGSVTITAYNEDRSITASCTVTVGDYENLIVDENRPVSLNPFENASYLFTPDADGSYTFWFEGEVPGWPGFRIFDHSTGEELFEGDRQLVVDLEGGVTYRVQLENYSDRQNEFTLRLTETVSVQSIYLEMEEFHGVVGDEAHLTLNSDPVCGNRNDVVWTVEDPSVVELYGSNSDGTPFRMLKAGRTTVTATLGELSASCEVIVEQPLGLVEGQVGEYTIYNQQTLIFAFTPTEDGQYAFWDENGYTHPMQLSGPDLWMEGQVMQPWLEAGNTYILRVSNHFGQTLQLRQRVDKTVPLTGIRLMESDYYGYIAEHRYANVVPIPGNGALEDVTWEIGDEQIVTLADSWGIGARFRLREFGETTITARTENGLTATANIKVDYASVMPEDNVFHYGMDNHSYHVVHFQVPEDGHYIIWDERNNWHGVEVFDFNENFLAGNDNYVEFDAVAGKDYLLYLHCYSDQWTDYVYHLDPVAETEFITLSESEIHAFEGMMIWVNVNYTPANASREEITWTISGDDAAEIRHESSVNCGLYLTGAGTFTLTAQTANGKTASCEITVQGTDPIEEGTPVEMLLEPHQSYGFAFTAHEDTQYCFWDTVKNWNCRIEVFNGNGDHIFGSTDAVWFHANAGETYLITVYNDCDGETEHDFRLAACVPPEELVIAVEEFDSNVGRIINISAGFEPINSFGPEVSWSFSDESAAEVLYDENQSIRFKLLKEGTLTVTASSSAGSDSFTINVTEAEAIEPGFCQDVALDTHDQKNYAFTPDETGHYSIWTTSDSWHTIFITDPTRNEMFQYDDLVHYWFEAGNTYLIDYVNPNDHETTATLHLEKTVEATGIQINREDYNGYVGEMCYMAVEPIPMNSILEEVQWTTSNEEVARIHYTNFGYAEIQLCGTGTAVIGAFANGYHDTWVVNVTDPEHVSLNSDFYSSIEPGQNATYLFTAPKDGTYVLMERSESGHGMDIYRMNGEVVTVGHHAIEFEAREGESFIIKVFNDSGDDGWYYHRIIEKGTIVEIALQRDRMVAFEGQPVDFHVNYLPMNMGFEEVTWSVSDPEIAEIGTTQDGFAQIWMRKTGTVTVTATTVDSGMTASCDVTVLENFDIAQQNTLNLNLFKGGMATYRFTPETGGHYTIWSDDPWNQLTIYITDMEDGSWERFYDLAQYEFEPGKEYQIDLDNSGTYNADYIIKWKPTVEPGRVYINWSDYAGFAGSYAHLHMVTEPVNAFIPGECSWSTSNPDVVEIVERDGGFCVIKLKQPGEAAITMQCGSFTAACPVKVQEVTTILADISYGAMMSGGDYKIYSFTAEKEGDYTFWDSQDLWPQIFLFDEDGWEINNSNGSMRFHAREGETFYFKIRAQRMDQSYYSFKVALDGPPTSLSFGFTELTAYKGFVQKLWANPVNANEWSEEIVEWRISNPALAEVEEKNYNYAAIRLKGVGEVTITAVSENGLETSVKLTVVEPEYLELDQTFQLQLGYNEEKLYFFTPEESGNYTLWKDGDWWLGIELFDYANDRNYYGGNFLQYDLEAGQTYGFRLYNDQKRDISYTINFAKTVPVQQLQFREPTMIGFVGGSEWADLRWFPGNARREELTWSVDQEGIVMINDRGEDGCSLSFLKAGTVTLTAATESGKSASLQIKVMETKPILLGQQASVNLEPMDAAGFVFVPETTGEYIIWDDSREWINFNVLDADGRYLSNGANDVQFTGTAGKTYILVVRNYNENQGYTGNIRVDEAVDVQSMDIYMNNYGNYPDTYSGVVGEVLNLTAMFTPVNSRRTDLTWTVDKEGVVEILNNYGSMVELSLTNTGTVTLTASAGGKSTSLVLTVGMPEVLNAGDHKSVTLDYEERQVYTFTAPETASYVLWFESQYYAAVNVRDITGRYLWNGYNERRVIEAQAGETYYVDLTNYNHNFDALTFDFAIEKAVDAEKMVFNGPDTYYAYEGTMMMFGVLAEPMNGLFGETEWSSSDPDVVRFEEIGKDYARFSVVKAGSTTITVRTKDGSMEESFALVVKTLVDLQLDTDHQIQQREPNEYSLVAFTPAEDGTYTLSVDTDETVKVWLYERDGNNSNMQTATLTGANNTMTVDLVGGITYWMETILVGEGESDATGSYSLHVSAKSVTTPLKITTQPENFVGAINSNATFTVAVNKEDVQYQWYYSGDNGETWHKSGSTGNTTNTLTVQIKDYRLTQLYRCEITDGEGNKVTSQAVAMLLPPSTIEIVHQPADVYGAPAEQMTISLEATGEGLTYRWYYSADGGETWSLSWSSGYSTAAVSPVLRAYNSGRLFKCLITDKNGNTEWSDVAAMVLDSSEIVIHSQPESYTGKANDLTAFTVVAEGTNLEYRWYYSEDGGETWQASFNTGYNTASMQVRLYAYRSGYQYKCVLSSGGQVKAETVPAVLSLYPQTAKIVSHPMNAGAEAYEYVTFHVEATGENLKYQWQYSSNGGETWTNSSGTGSTTDTIEVMVIKGRDGQLYRCQVTDDSGVPVNSLPATLRLGAAPVITLQPADITAAANETVYFTVEVTGANLTYQWQYSSNGGGTWTNSGMAGNKTASLEVKAASYRNGQMYRCMITNEFGSILSEAATLTVQ